MAEQRPEAMRAPAGSARDDTLVRHLFGKEPEPVPPPVRLAAANGHRLDGVRIETERLILRHLGADDFPEYLAIASDPETFRYAQRGPLTSDEAWTRLLRSMGHWWLMGYGLFAVEEKATGRFVGEVGLGDFRRGLGTAFDGVPEAAWTIASWAQGCGYATEAAAAAHAWMEVRVNAQRTVCIIHADNIASVRVAAKLGYAPFGQIRYRGYPALLLERGWPLAGSAGVRGPAAKKTPGRRSSLGPIVGLMKLCIGPRRRLAGQ
jgi:RimJ/RimL family protein N-acetyltransferase